MASREVIQATWCAGDERLWCEALVAYWSFLNPKLVLIEEDMAALHPGKVEVLDEEGWFEFLLEGYFRWKYTAPNRYATTTSSLKRQVEEIGLGGLLEIRDDILERGACDARGGMEAAGKIGGLGPAGASGLLSLLFPERFGTVDQFVVKFLLMVDGLPEAEAVGAMKPEGLTLKDSLVLLEIMQRKAEELNEAFGSTSWTPRRIDKVMWTLGHA
jgi:hypothetical protein